MKRKLTALLLAGALLALTGCQLARPEQDADPLGGDRFVGVYAVYDGGTGWEPSEFVDENGEAATGWSINNYFWNSDNPLLTEMGTESLDTAEFGPFSIPKLVLIAQYDKEKHGYVFPGLEGFSLFTTLTYEEDGAPCTNIFNDMMGSVSANITSTDTGTTTELEGTIYVGPPLGAGDDWNEYREDQMGGMWTLYRVYQTEDGTVYLDGHGNTYSGTNVGSSSATLTDSRTTTVDGEEQTEAVSVTVHMENATRLTRLTVTQFDENDQPIKAQDLPLQEDLPEIHCLDAAAWVLVEAESSEGVERTLYNVPGTEEQPIYHPVVLLTDSGMGYGASLMISR